MGYVPETRWIGGVCPTPPDPGSVPKPQRALPRMSDKRRAIIHHAIQHGPVSAVDIARAVGQTVGCVRDQLRIVVPRGVIVKVFLKHPTQDKHIAYYSGAPEK
jgi:hypothetical protein